MKASAGKQKSILIIVENLPVPFDRRVWQEATTLTKAGYCVSVICPTGKGFESGYEYIDGIHIHRYSLPVEGSGAFGYIMEYSIALLKQFLLALKVAFIRGFDAIHACNPPDNIFIIAAFFKLLGKKFLFDHHDINPELYEAKFGNKGLIYKLICALERWTFEFADVSIATNESYRQIAITRGRMDPSKVFVVRSGPDLDRVHLVRPNSSLKHGRRYLVGYVGVMGKQEGIDYLLRAIHHIVNAMNRTDIHFSLVGGGTELQSMREYSSALGISDYVTFTGRVPDKQMLEVLSTADVCVNPDVANEMNDKSTMNKIMEYMALSKPIVQFDLAEGRFSAQQASLYAGKNDHADFANKIVQLIDDTGLRSRMGSFGYRRVTNELAWKYEAPKLLAAYDLLLNGNTALSSSSEKLLPKQSTATRRTAEAVNSRS